MVRAILEGRKTVTRRVVKDIPWLPGVNERFSQARSFSNGGLFHIAGSLEMTKGFRCPYGQVGDRLWVKEAWRVARRWDATPSSALPHENGLTVAYAAGGSRAHDDTARFVNDDAYSPWDAEWVGRTRSPIHMPRWASRITLEVTAVRVERLQDVSEQSAWDEGVQKFMGGPTPWKSVVAPASVHGFAAVWESINGAGSWAANPWVWVVEFKRIEKEVPHGG
jgi:hypothetical protein